MRELEHESTPATFSRRARWPGRSILLLFVLAFALPMPLVGCVVDGSSKRTVNIPHLALRDISGRTHYLSDHIGKKVVVMSFWATWCMPCRQELAVLQTMYEEKKGEGLEVLAISVDGPESIARVRPFVKQAGYTFTVLLDKETRASGLYNPRKQMPMMHIFDRTGRIVYSHTSFQPGHAPALRRKIRSILSGDRPDREEADQRKKRRRRDREPSDDRGDGEAREDGEDE